MSAQKIAELKFKTILNQIQPNPDSNKMISNFQNELALANWLPDAKRKIGEEIEKIKSSCEQDNDELINKYIPGKFLLGIVCRSIGIDIDIYKNLIIIIPSSNKNGSATNVYQNSSNII